MSALAPNVAVALPGSTVEAVAWRARGQLHVTVIAKATFAFAPEGVMSRVEPEEIVRAEVHQGKNPARSVALTTDLAPGLARADVIFTGTAHAPSGAPVPALPVRLAIFADERRILDKRLVVQDPRGVTRAPITYERTWLGLDEKENPYGVPFAAGAAAIVDPAQPGRPAGFGPLGRFWPARKRLLRDLPRRVLEGPIAEIPDDFDWSYFQAAPPDQRTSFLGGSEWILLEGLHPVHPLFRSCLPGARGVARVHGLSAFGVAEGQELALYADTLRIEGDEQRCSLVWRRSFPVASEAALAAVRVVAGVALGAEVLRWIDPRTVTVAQAPPVPRPATMGDASPATGTLMVSPEEEALPQEVLPFRSGAADPIVSTSQGVPRPAPATGTLAISPAGVAAVHEGAASGPKPRPPAQALVAGTLAISPDSIETLPATTLPFREGASPLAQAPLRPPIDRTEPQLTGTLAVWDESATGEEVLPFQTGTANEPRSPMEAPPGTPGSALEPHHVPAPPPPEEPPALQLRPEVREVTVTRASPPPPPPEAPRRLPDRPPPPRVDVPNPDPQFKRGLYSRFNRRG